MKILFTFLFSLMLAVGGIAHAGQIGDAGGFGGGAASGGGGGGGGGTLITSGAGAFGSGTSQTGGVLTGVMAANHVAPTNTSGTFVSIGTSSNGGTGATVTANAPASIVNGNALLLGVAVAGSSGSEVFTFPAGFTQIGSNVCSTVGAIQCIAIACKIASSEAGNYTTTWTGGNGSSSFSQVTQVSGINCTNDTLQSAHASATTVTVPALTPTGNNDFLFGYAAVAVNGSTSPFVPGTGLLTNQNANHTSAPFTGTWGGAGQTPSFIFNSNGSAADFTALVAAFTPTATASATVMTNGGPVTTNSLYNSGNSTTGGMSFGTQFIAQPNLNSGSSSATTTGFGIQQSNGSIMDILTAGDGGGTSIQMDTSHIASFISMGGGAWTAQDALLLNGGGLDILSHDANQDLGVLSTDSSNNFDWGCVAGASNKCSSGATESADNYFGTNNGNTFHLCFDDSGRTTCTDSVTVLAKSMNVLGGATLQQTGGTAPTATCSGGSTGVAIEANANCTGNTAPFACCTGSGTGTCRQSTNNHGVILTSSSASTNCTITFSASGTWNQAPFCTYDDGAASVTPTAVSAGATSTTTAVLDFASATSKTFVYHCF